MDRVTHYLQAAQAQARASAEACEAAYAALAQAQAFSDWVSVQASAGLLRPAAERVAHEVRDLEREIASAVIAAQRAVRALERQEAE